MDDFQPEDELKPDTSDRPAPRGKKPVSSSKLPISKQHIMIAVGILVLLLLVLGIGSAMNGPSKSTPEASGQGSERNIDLSTNSSTDNASNTATAQQSAATPSQTDAPAPPSAEATSVPTSSTVDTNAAASATTNTPSTDQTAAITLPVGAATLDRSAKLGSQPQVTQQFAATAPTPPVHRVPSEQRLRPKAPVTHAEPREPVHRSEGRYTVPEHHEIVSHRPPESENTVAKKAVAPKPPVRKAEREAVATTSHPTKALPAPVVSQEVSSGKGYTLQLSAASREDTLNAWAKQQNLSSYHVYKTSRDGQAWYVLTTGSYQTPAEAKSAISSLPEAVKAKGPWVKPMSQVRKESAQ
ncbi:SPOR domain-containing protein [Rosenbergiella australiborealis]|uniref:SPOR domain-containing protein n=1 Tax=Rosenbergiella australiborealis TaxID=1544696 RepID=A0ABS5T5B0_9GAMM|nr:SPOR domain-containing protein [Rosenbergiella australiborealis]MBT0727317.1 SPOR domain-containing protein [Rosenbergiella australiborealis]